MIKDCFGEDIIGQDRAKQTLNFCLELQHKIGFLRPIFLTAARGYGKTTISRKIGDNLLDEKGKRKTFIEVNGSSIRSLTAFVSQIISPFVSNRSSTLFIDEIHLINPNVKDWLLTVLQPGMDNLSHAVFDGQQYDFDFTKFSFLAASTNAEKLSAPLKERMRRVDLEPYQQIDLVKILDRNLKGVKFSENVEHEIVKCARQNPRLTTFIARDILDYCKARHVRIVNNAHWLLVKRVFDIKPLGLHSAEIAILRYLDRFGPQSLTSIAAKLGLASTTIRQDVENYLLANGLLSIDGKRFITEIGRKVLSEC